MDSLIQLSRWDLANANCDRRDDTTMFSHIHKAYTHKAFDSRFFMPCKSISHKKIASKNLMPCNCVRAARSSSDNPYNCIRFEKRQTTTFIILSCPPAKSMLHWHRLHKTPHSTSFSFFLLALLSSLNALFPFDSSPTVRPKIAGHIT